MEYTIQSNAKGSRSMQISEDHLLTLEKYSLLSDLLDSNGIVNESVLDKLRLNVRALLEHTNADPDLLRLCKEVLFHDNMKSFALHQLILLYIDWQSRKKVEDSQESE